MSDARKLESLSALERRRRDLPHWEEPGATYAVRFSVWERCGVRLDRSDIAPIVVSALRYHHGRRHWLYDHTVMPDHVHAIMKPIVHDGRTEYLWQILRDIKNWTARRINERMERSGPVWRDESWDRIIRNQTEYEYWADYILQNARVAGLFEHALDWPWWGHGGDQSAR